MTVQTMTVGRSHANGLSRTSALLARAGLACTAALRAVDHWLDHRPDEALTASQVMDWANRIERSDPSFAADLRGAAMRADAGL
jgi:hypothetical protein